MDGVLYRGEKVLPGAIEFMESIQDIPHVFLTNNPTRLPSDVVNKLCRLGFPNAREEQVITSGIATAIWLSKQKLGFRFYAIGAVALTTALGRYGIEDSKNADYVVVGEGEGLDFNSLTLGVNLILQKGAKLISTNPDCTVNAEGRVLPGGGALVAPFIVATGIKAITIGKPNPLLFEMGLEVLGLAPGECLMVGDRPDTDIGGANNLGIQTALVRTGCFGSAEEIVDHALIPDIDVGELFELMSILERRV